MTFFVASSVLDVASAQENLASEPAAETTLPPGGGVGNVDDHAGHDHPHPEEPTGTATTADPSTIRDKEEIIEEMISTLPPEVAEEAKLARTVFKQTSKELTEEMIRLRELQVRFVNGIDNSPADAKEFREQRLKVAELLETHFDNSLALFRIVPSGEAATYLVTMMQLHYAQDQYDNETYEAAARLIDLGQNYEYLFLIAGRAAIANGEFETAKRLYEALKDQEKIPEIDQRLMMQATVIEEQFKAEQERLAATDPESRPQVRLVTTQGEVLIELFSESAPSTVAHFLKLVEQGFYDGQDFSQVMDGLLALTGDPRGDGRGNSGEFLVDEHTAENAHHALRGSLIMAKIPQGPNEFIENSASSQFAIAYLPLPSASTKQTIFGRVIEGMDAVSRLRRVDPNKKSEKKGVQLPPDAIIRAEVVRRGAELPPSKYVDLKAMIEEATKDAVK